MVLWFSDIIEVGGGVGNPINPNYSGFNWDKQPLPTPHNDV